MFWGSSEARDLYDMYISVMKDKPKKLDILMFGMGDPSHVLKTIAKIYHHGAEDVEISFYIVEGCVELMARDMLLINIALEDEEYFSLNGKTHLYMDLFGNSLLKSASFMYLNSKCEQFLKLITDSDYADKYATIFDFKNLKYKERDQMELAFTFWKNKNEHKFDIKKYWDDQNRVQLKERYDHRDGAFDWDLQMKLKSYGAKQICTQEYKHWRECGVAFTFPEFEQTYPNKTFAMDLKKNGNKFFHRGYVGDMSVGPYIPFGLECNEESMLKSNFGTNQCRSTDITERNVYEMFHEIAHNEPFDKTKDNKHFRQYGAVKLQCSDGFDVGKTSSDNKLNLVKYDKPLKVINNVKIIFLSVDEVLNIQNNHRFQQKFDIIFVATNYFAFLKKEFENILCEKSLFLFETHKYSVLRQEQINEQIQKIRDYAKELNLTPVTSFSLNVVTSIVKFKK
ncbi:unnamed protein product [Diamesa tonsa]